MTTAGLDSLLGETLDSRYRITALIRTDPFRTVFQAQDISGEAADSNDISVVVDTSSCASENFNRYLEASFLRHPDLARVFHAGWLDTPGQRTPYIVTERPDATMSDLLDRDSLSLLELIGVTQQALAGLAHLHSENLVYCALQPHSIWRVGGEWKLSDYSELRVPGNRNPQETWRLLTSAEIAAPPEAYHGTVGSAWDVWALAAMLGRIVRPPVGKDAEPRKWKSMGALLPEWEELIGNCSAPEPGDRPGVEEIQQVLEQLRKQAWSAPELPEAETASLLEAPGLETPPSSPLRAERILFASQQRKSRSIPWALMLQVSLIAAVVFAGSLLLTRRANRNDPSASNAATAAPAEAPPASNPAQPGEDSSPSPQTNEAPTVSDARARIAAVITRWANAVKRRDAAGQMSCYAPVVDTYFGQHNVSAVALEKEKAMALNANGAVRRFDVNALRFDQVAPDWAVVSFDKIWEFGGSEALSGSAREQFVLRSFEGQWKITSEREIKVYSSKKRTSGSPEPLLQ